MEIIRLQYDDFVEHKNSILYLLIESFVSSFDISQEKCKDIAREKLDQLEVYMKNGSAILIGAIDNGALIGFLWSYKHDYYGQPRMHLNHSAVEKQYRGKGIGTRLDREAEGIAMLEGIEVLDLAVSESNTAARKMFESQGYTTERRYMSKRLR